MLKSFFSRHVLLAVTLAVTCNFIGMFLLVKSVNIALSTAGYPLDFWYCCIPGGFISFISLISLALLSRAGSIKNNESSSNSKDPKKSEELGNDLVDSVFLSLVLCVGVGFLFIIFSA